MTGLEPLSLCAAVARLRAGELTCEDYTAALLARTESLEKTIHAFAWLDRGHALGAARAADALRSAGRKLGRLHGVPIGVKDIFATAGIPTGMGSPAFDGFVPEKSATMVVRAESEGAFIFGKTVTAELAYFTPGPTRNPWNPAHTPGGSSMGSAAAVAAGMLPLAFGTQTNGSVIRPAAFCGCVGFKPGEATLATAGIQPFSPTLDQPGLFTRSVEDAALAFAAVREGPEASRAESWPLAPRARPPRLAAVRSPVWSQAEPAARQSFDTMLARLRAGGAEVTEAELPAAFEKAHGVHRTIMAYEAARTLGEIQSRQRAKLSAVLNRFLDEGHAIDAPAHAEALAQRQTLQAGFGTFLSRYDAIVTPPARGEAPATLEHTGDPVFCTIWTLLGVPALTLPVGFGPSGLPLGLQIAGTLRDDARLLRVARWVEQAVAFDPGFPERNGRLCNKALRP
jgi:Asp-tRNA(Asn)/Glu-tRNA(Gln) amidotransferase A subunit family amidase